MCGWGVHAQTVVFGDFHEDVFERGALFLEGAHPEAEPDQAFHQIRLAVVAAGEAEDDLLSGNRRSWARSWVSNQAAAS